MYQLAEIVNYCKEAGARTDHQEKEGYHNVYNSIVDAEIVASVIIFIITAAFAILAAHARRKTLTTDDDIALRMAGKESMSNEMNTKSESFATRHCEHVDFHSFR